MASDLQDIQEKISIKKIIEEMENKKNMRVILDRVLVQPIDEGYDIFNCSINICEDGSVIELLSSTKEDMNKYLRGKVISVGSDVNDVREGDIVLFGRNSGFILDVDGIYHVIDQRDILVILNK